MHIIFTFLSGKYYYVTSTIRIHISTVSLLFESIDSNHMGPFLDLARFAATSGIHGARAYGDVPGGIDPRGRTADGHRFFRYVFELFYMFFYFSQMKIKQNNW